MNEWRLSSIQMSLLKTPGIEIDFQKLWDNGDIRHYQVMPPDKQQRFCEYVSQELGIADPEYFQLFMEHYDQVAQTKDPVFQKASLRYVVDFAERIWKEKHAVREEHARLSSEGL